MAALPPVDSEFFKKEDQGAINTEVEARIKSIEQDYVTSNNIGQKFRGSLPIYHSQASKTDYNTLEFGDHLLWDFGTGETNAPPVPKAQWMFVEMIKTHIYSADPTQPNAIQRAWGYDKGFLATRARFQTVWSAWEVMETKPPPTEP